MIRSSRANQASFIELPDQICGMLIERGSSTNLANGSILAVENMPASHLYFIESGWVYRYNMTRDGARQIIGIALPGDFCNLDALGSPYLSYGLRTRTVATITSLPKTLVLSTLERSTETAAFFRRAMSIENAVSGRLTMIIGRKTARARFAHFICEIATRLGYLNESIEGVPFAIPFTQEDIGDLLGLTAVHISRTAAALKADQVIDWNSHRVNILDVAGLIRIAEFDDRYLGKREDGRAAVSFNDM